MHTNLIFQIYNNTLSENVGEKKIQKEIVKLTFLDMCFIH